MPHGTDIILTLAVSLVMALIFGVITQKLKMSPIVGYLIAGIIAGPYCPLFNIDIDTAQQFAEIGVILLMFGVGLHFHLKDLIAVRKIAIPGALAQISASAAVGMITAHAFGWSWSAGLVFGIAISVASTVVLTRVLADNRALYTPTGHIAIGWLIVEDLFTIFVLVLLPTFFANSPSTNSLVATFAITILKLTLLVLFVLVAGQKLIPKILDLISKTGSRDLFTLAIFALAIGIAVASAKFFGASMALGAFLAGMVVGQSDFYARAASEALPMRDAFAVLFFVSVGMLLEPASLITNWQLILATLVIILIVKPLSAITVVLLMKKPLITAISIGVALAQVGEFSFILASLGVSLGVLPIETSSAIITAAIITITLNPMLYKLINPLMKYLSKNGISNIKSEDFEQMPELCGGKVIIVGYGPVGKIVTQILSNKGIRTTVIEMNIDTVKQVNKKNDNIIAVHGDASQREILSYACIENSEAIIISSPIIPAEEIIEIVRALNPDIQIIVNTTYIKEIAKLKSAGANIVFSGEGAVGQILSNYILNEFDTQVQEFELEETE